MQYTKRPSVIVFLLCGCIGLREILTLLMRIFFGQKEMEETRGKHVFFVVFVEPCLVVYDMVPESYSVE